MRRADASGRGAWRRVAAVALSLLAAVPAGGCRREPTHRTPGARKGSPPPTRFAHPSPALPAAVSAGMRLALHMPRGAAPGTAAAGAPGGRVCLAPSAGATGYRNEVVVLMYHAFRPDPIPGDDISPADFAAQLALFRHDGFHVISLQQFAAFVDGRGSVPPNALLLTFDNGYASMYHYAYPLLLRYRDPATLFLIAGWLYPGHAPPGVQPLSLTDLRRMLRSGLISLGTQGWNLHQSVEVAAGTTEAASVGRAWDPSTSRSESPAAYARRVQDDLLRAQRTLRPLAHGTIRAFAFPFGDYQGQLIQLLHQTGFRYLFTDKVGWANVQCQSPDVLYRINVGAYGVTPADAVSTVRAVAVAAALHPAWRPPARFVEVWH